MKLESISIRDFRGIESLDLSFKDELGLIRDRIPIVGPNTSGKTTILDAIALSLPSTTASSQLGEGLRFSPRALVRSGAVRTQVSTTVWFSDDEIEASREVLARVDSRFLPSGPLENLVTVHWTFPDPEGQRARGSCRYEPKNALPLLLGRRWLESYLHVPGLGPRLFRRLGDVFMFDQQRTGLSKRLSSDEVGLLGQLLNPDRLGGIKNGNDPVASGGIGRPEPVGQGLTSDPRLILTSLAMRAQVAQDPEATEREDFAQLKRLYERVCHPHTIGELYNTEHGLDMEFRSDRSRYHYDGLSSGQQMILLMLLQFATRRIHRSIVLIDELELHLHPLWQSRLYTALSSLGEDNQYFFTTHSTYLRDTIRDEFCHMTGDLAEPAVMG